MAIVSNADGTVTVQFDIDTLLKLDSFAHDMVQQCFREPIKVERFVGGRNVPKGDYDVMHQKTRIACMGEQATADYFGAPRSAENPVPGPFAVPGGGAQALKVWAVGASE